MVRRRAAALIGVPAACAVLFFGGCAARRPPTAKVSTADVAIRDAEQAEASQYAPLELRLAREKLERARKAMDDGEYDRARRLSEEAFVDAQLAEAKSRAEKARRNANEVRKSIEALRIEAERPLIGR